MIRKVRPSQCTLVPDGPDAVTSDHGWDLVEEADRLRPIISELRDLGIRVSLFMDADSIQWRRHGLRVARPAHNRPPDERVSDPDADAQ